MTSFTLSQHPALTLAPGASSNIGEHVVAVTGPKSRVLVVCDPAMIELGLAGPVLDNLNQRAHTVEVFSDLQSDPREHSVDAAVLQARSMDAQCVVGLGGGSALDTAKLVANLTQTGEACARFRLAAQALPFRKTGLIAVPTTAGTGSETTGVSIVSDPGGTKNWFFAPSLKPDLAVLDPQLTVGLPAWWTFYTGMDALVHCIESRTNRYRFDENDVFSERGIIECTKYLERAVQDPGSLEARSGMMIAAANGGLAISNTGCALAHNIGHALGSLAHIPHGRAVSVALVQTLDWVIEGNRDAFDRVGELMGCRNAEGLCDKLNEMAEVCGERLSLTEKEKSGLSSKALAQDMVSEANIAMLESTARTASDSDVEALAEQILAT